MAKKEQPTPSTDDAVDKEIEAIMGPLPQNAHPTIDNPPQEEISTDEPGGAPEVTATDVDESTEVKTEIEAPAEKNDEKEDDITAAVSEVNEQLKSQVEGSELIVETKVVDDVTLDDPATTAAVTDIIAKEGDELLAAQDAQKAGFETPKKEKKHPFGFIKRWWGNKRARTITLAALAAGLLALSFYPATRYAILNVFGVRAGLNLQVIDATYGVPIKNASVTAGGKTGTTDDSGKVSLSGVRLGKTELVITKRSFTPVKDTIIVGWGSNPFADPVQMTAVGSTYNFVITDWLSGKPIEKAEVSDGESTAITDKDGKTTLTIQPTDSDIKLSIKADDYRTETLAISATDTDSKAVKLVAGKPDIFVSKRSGKYDLYRRDVDGKNESIIVGATGSEQDPLGLLVHQDGNIVAFVSTREGKRDSSGYLLSNLYMVDATAKNLTKVSGTEASQIQLIDWVGDKLVFVKISSGPSAATAGRQQILVYDLKQDKVTELASANYFNDVEVYKGQVYYAQSTAPGITPQLIRVNPDGTAKTTLVDKEVWQTYRTSYTQLLANAADNKWYQQNLGDAKMTALSGAPASPTHRIYIDNPNGENTVWVDNRDGKGVLILQNLKDTSVADKIIFSKGGLGYPIRWLSKKHLLVRVSNSQETADYILNIEGGDPVKVGDVTNTATTNRWYYYQ